MIFSRDRFSNTDVKTISRASFTVIDALQGFSPEAKVAALAVCFKLYSDTTDMTVSELMTVVNNVMHEGESKRSEFRAISDYLKHEMD